MLEDIKKELLNNPEKLKDVLEHFGYCNIVIRPTYMQFGRDEESSKKSIVIKLENNNWLYVHDYARNIQTDIFSYMCYIYKIILDTFRKKESLEDFMKRSDKETLFNRKYMTKKY